MSNLLLSELKLTEGKAPNRIQVCKVGTFYDPRYGTFTFNEAFLNELKKNFDSKVRGVDISVDYKHESDDKAAAWFKELELTDGGKELWATVDWTPPGETRVANKEFRYISPDIRPNYEDNETRKKHGPVLMGAALTNRPVIKGMAPTVQLNEASNKGAFKMTDQELLEKHSKTLAENIRLTENLKDAEKKLNEFDMTPEQMMAKIKELESKLATSLAENGEIKASKELSEKTAAFDKLLSEGKAVPAQKDAYLKGDMNEFLAKAGDLNLSEGGSTDLPAGSGDSKPTKIDQKVEKMTADQAQDKLLELAEAHQKEDGNSDVSLDEALSFVLSEPKNKGLADKYASL